MKDNRAVTVSVIIPLYNKELYIKRAIDSVLAQTFGDFECIVVDDGSTDLGALMVRSIDDRRVRLISQQHGGASRARNRAVQEAKGRLAAFLDGDDEWMPHFLERIVELAESFPQAGLFATAYEIFEAGGQVRQARVRGIAPPPWRGLMPDYFRAAALGEPPFCTSSAAVPLDLLIGAGGFSPGKRMGEDVDLWARLALKYPVAFDPEPGARYRHDARDRACDTFRREDRHPFIDTYLRWSANGGAKAGKEHYQRRSVRLYVDRLRVENGRQYALSGEYDLARAITADMGTGAFLLKRILWGSPLNRLTHRVWKLRYGR
jgi:glycosyltransferase involved in cell wall biosynthesis